MENTTSADLAWGFGAAAVSTVFFGSNFVPVKKVDIGDGVFFQFVMCNAILLVGLVVHAIRNFPKFYPLALVGGAMWTVGNLCVVPIIKTIGLGLGFLIWAVCSMLCAWASGRFGLFGVQRDDQPQEVLNYIGVALCGVSAVVYMFVRTEVSHRPRQPSGYLTLNDCLVNLAGTQANSQEGGAAGDQDRREGEPRPDDWFERLSPGRKRVMGSTMAVFAGILFGFSITPYLYIVNNYNDVSDNALDYIFVTFLGVYAMSVCAFVVYVAVRRDRADVSARAVLPGIASGLMWGVGDVALFVATAALGETISFPIITTAPPVVTNLWTILLFKEIRGSRNLLVCGAAFCVSCLGVAIIVVSKVV